MPLLRSALILFLLFTFTAALAQDDVKKSWDPANPLQWTDFQGVVDPSSTFSANTHSGTSYTWHMQVNDGQATFTFTASSFMDRSKSWSRPEKQTADLLKHEQLHFDISEFFARKLLEELNGYTYTKEYRAQIAQIYQQLSIQRQTMEALYDEQTNHSRNKVRQAQWEVYVVQLLSNNYTYKQALAGEPLDE